MFLINEANGGGYLALAESCPSICITQQASPRFSNTSYLFLCFYEDEISISFYS